MRSGDDYLGRESLGLWQGKMGYIRKNAIILCWFLHAENSLLFQTNSNHNYKKE